MLNLEISKPANVFPYHIKENSNLIGKVEVKDGYILCTLGEYYKMHSFVKTDSQREKVEFYKNTFVESFGYPKDKKGKEFIPPWCGEEYICYVDVSIHDIYSEGENDIYLDIYDFYLEHWDENRFYPMNP